MYDEQTPNSELITVKIDVSHSSTLFELISNVQTSIGTVSTDVPIKIYFVGGRTLMNNDWEQFFDYLISLPYQVTIIYRGYFTLRFLALFESFQNVQIHEHSILVMNHHEIIYPLRHLKSPEIKIRYLQRLKDEYAKLPTGSELDVIELDLLGFDNIVKF